MFMISCLEMVSLTLRKCKPPFFLHRLQPLSAWWTDRSDPTKLRYIYYMHFKIHILEKENYENSYERSAHKIVPSSYDLFSASLIYSEISQILVTNHAGTHCIVMWLYEYYAYRILNENLNGVCAYAQM